jgi:hypothetical protein
VKRDQRRHLKSGHVGRERHCNGHDRRDPDEPDRQQPREHRDGVRQRGRPELGEQLVLGYDHRDPPDAAAVSDPGHDSHVDVHVNSDRDIHADGDRDRHAHADRDGDIDPDRGVHLDRHAHADCVGNMDPDIHGDGDGNRDRDAYADRDRDAYADRDRDIDPDIHGDIYRNSDRARDPDSAADRDEAPAQDATPTPVPTAALKPLPAGRLLGLSNVGLSRGFSPGTRDDAVPPPGLDSSNLLRVQSGQTWNGWCASGAPIDIGINHNRVEAGRHSVAVRP